MKTLGRRLRTARKLRQLSQGALAKQIGTSPNQIVKRALRSDEAGWMLVSDNPEKDSCPTRPWPDDAKVIGEMKWYGQSSK